MTEKMPIKEAKKKFIKRSFYCGVVAIFVCWFMKLFGFDYFGLDLDNKFFNDLDTFLNKYYLKDILITIILNFQFYFMACITQKEQGKKIVLFLLKMLPFTIAYKLITNNFVTGNIVLILDILYLLIITTKFNIKKIPRGFLVIILNLIYQAISLSIRSLELQAHTYSFVASQILNIDYFILLYLNKEMEVKKNGK